MEYNCEGRSLLIILKIRIAMMKTTVKMILFRKDVEAELFVLNECITTPFVYEPEILRQTYRFILDLNQTIPVRYLLCGHWYVNITITNCSFLFLLCPTTVSRTGVTITTMTMIVVFFLYLPFIIHNSPLSYDLQAIK